MRIRIPHPAMKNNNPNLFGFIACVACLVLAGTAILPARADDAATGTSTSAAATNNPEADKAWKEVRRAGQSPPPPAAWQDKEPTREEVAKYYVPLMIKAADKSRDFYMRFPDHPKAAEARKQEYTLLSMAAQKFGDTEHGARLDALMAELLKDPKIKPDDRFRLRLGQLNTLFAGLPGTMAEFRKSEQALRKDFPEREEVYQLIMGAAFQCEGDQAKALAQEVMDSPAPEQLKAKAKGLLGRMDALGKTVDIQYTALDGRQVDIAQLKGKVVLIDFWATWCQPCVGEVPNVKAAYEKLHPKGFEIVGISFDQSKEALEKFVAEKEMAWPQYFDGKGWENKFGQTFGINSIPTMWLVDKKGNLRDVNARGALEEKVMKLLGEE
jgi:thiol-disulfide isomerase/thioredoxin